MFRQRFHFRSQAEMAVIKTLQRVWGSIFTKTRYINSLIVSPIKTVSEKVIFQFTLNYLFYARKPVFYCKKIDNSCLNLATGAIWEPGDHGPLVICAKPSDPYYRTPKPRFGPQYFFNGALYGRAALKFDLFELTFGGHTVKH